MVVNKAPNGEAEPFFDRTRQVWIAPWRKPDGRVGRPTGKTRALEAQSGELADSFTDHTTVGELSVWWLGHVARHRVRPTSLATYRKHASVTLEQGVEFGLATQNVARKVKAPKAAPKARRTITPELTQRLIAECDPRFAAAAALCFVQGWRISEALGLGVAGPRSR